MKNKHVVGGSQTSGKKKKKLENVSDSTKEGSTADANGIIEKVKLPCEISVQIDDVTRSVPSDDNRTIGTTEDSILREARDSMHTDTEVSVGKYLEEEKKFDSDHYKKIIERATANKLKANTLFKKNKFREAIVEYTKAVNELNQIIEDKAHSDNLNVTNVNWVRLECINNIAVCYLLLKDYQEVLNFTKEVLAVNPNNFISLSYRSKAYIALSLYKEAVECIKKALSIKYSKTLMSLLKEIESKLPVEVKIKIEDKKEEKKSSFFFSVLNSILKFSKISSIGIFEYIKKYKYAMIIILAIWIIAYRTRLKNNLLFFLLKLRLN